MQFGYKRCKNYLKYYLKQTEKRNENFSSEGLNFKFPGWSTEPASRTRPAVLLFFCLVAPAEAHKRQQNAPEPETEMKYEALGVEQM